MRCKKTRLGSAGKIIEMLIDKRPLSSLLLLSLCSFCSQVAQATLPLTYPVDQQLYDTYPMDVMYFYGVTVRDALVRLFKGDYHRWPEHLQSLEFARTLDCDNPVRRFFYPLVGVVQLAGNVSLRTGDHEHTIYEFNPYIAFRWANFPWNNYLTTSLAIGEGISYDTSVPSLESHSSPNTKRLLNYLMLEASVAAPSYPRLQLVFRIHHRSGAYGLYHAGNTGSNNIGLGLRYFFD